MGLRLTKFGDGHGEISYDGSFESPAKWMATAAGGKLEAKYFLSMEDPYLEYASNGRLYATDASGEDESHWFKFAPDVNGAPGTYLSEFLFHLDFGDEVPVWIMVDVPAGVDEDTRQDISIAASYIRLEATPSV